jgi:hypothetical protein
MDHQFGIGIQAGLSYRIILFPRLILYSVFIMLPSGLSVTIISLIICTCGVSSQVYENIRDFDGDVQQRQELAFDE